MTLERVELDISSKTKCVKINNARTNKFTMKNVLLKETIASSISSASLITFTANAVEIDGLVRRVDAVGSRRLEYYGSDFSQFCINYKTGQLGIKTLEGKGLFQGKVTEDTLQRKGYTQKTI
jgi:hypothetical protein